MEVGLDTVHSRNTYYYVRAEPQAERQPDWWEAEGGDGKTEAARESRTPAREEAAPDVGSFRKRTGEAEPAKLSTSLPVASKPRSTPVRPPARSEPPASGKPVTEAEREFQTLLSRGTDSADALVGEGFLAANRGEAARALRCAQSAVQKAPLLAEAHFLMGVLHADGGEADKAIESFNRALFLQPEFPMAHYHLAHLRAREGRAVEARRSFENAIELLESGIEPHFTGGFSPDQLLMICRQGLAGLGRQGGR
jgi:chemotaxis protein methyltransferase CheR